MPFPKKIKRDEFIKLTLLSGAAIYFNSCRSSNSKKITEKTIINDSAIKDTLPAKPLESSVTSTFKLFKKGEAE